MAHLFRCRARLLELPEPQLPVSGRGPPRDHGVIRRYDYGRETSPDAVDVPTGEVLDRFRIHVRLPRALRLSEEEERPVLRHGQAVSGAAVHGADAARLGVEVLDQAGHLSNFKKGKI